MVSINDIPSVIMPTQDGRYKYILIKIADKISNEKVVIRCGGLNSFHRIILIKFRCNTKGFGFFARGRQVQCLGGGKITVKKNGQRFVVFGKSLDFGAEDRRLTAKILKDSFPDFEIIAEST